MKKFAIYAFALFASATVLTSCGDDTETTPTVNVSAYSAVLVGAQNNSQGSFFSTNTGSVYKTSAYQTTVSGSTVYQDTASFRTNKVDVSFAETGEVTVTPKFISLDARSDQGLDKVILNKNATFFKESTKFLTKGQFDTAKASIKDIAQSSTKYVAVSQGKVYEAVSYVGGKKVAQSLIYVSNLSNNKIASKGDSITFDVRTVKY